MLYPERTKGNQNLTNVISLDTLIRPMFGSSLRPAVHVLFMLFVFYAYSGVHVLTVYINCMSYRRDN
jgi:hypothetical protein